MAKRQMPAKPPKPGRSMVIRLRLPEARADEVRQALRDLTTQQKGQALALGMALLGWLGGPNDQAPVEAVAGRVTTALVDAGAPQVRGRGQVVRDALAEALERLAAAYDTGTERLR